MPSRSILQIDRWSMNTCGRAKLSTTDYTKKSVEDVAAAVSRPFWFQLYVMRDRGFVRALTERVMAAGCSALVVTLDLNMLGQRHCDIKNGMTVPPRITLGNALGVAARPAWAMSILRGKRRNFGNLAGHIQEAHGRGSHG